MSTCFFVSDLHGKRSRYQRLFEAISQEAPQMVFLGGDLFPSGWTAPFSKGDFLEDFLVPLLENSKKKMGSSYPSIGVILGNDDPRVEEARIQQVAKHGLWHYLHNQRVVMGSYEVFGYSFVPPSPFLLKDWERYDVSRYVDPGCVSPQEGFRSIPVSPKEIRYSTIEKDLNELTNNRDLSNALFLFHAPPYRTKLDRAALDGKKVDHVPLDVHVGSIAIKRFIEQRQPKITLHGHIHESTRLTGKFGEKLGKTVMLQAAHEGPELSLISFDPHDPWKTKKRRLL